MQVQTRHGPSFAVARLLLAGGEPARVEPSAMVATSYGMAIEARAGGGMLRSLARAALGGSHRRPACTWTRSGQGSAACSAARAGS